MNQKSFRITRIILSSVIAVATTVMLLDYGQRSEEIFGFLSRWQLLPVSMAASVGVLLFWILATWMFGRVYCSTLCPLGTLQDLIARMAMRCRPKERRIYRYAPTRNAQRYFILLIMAASMVAGLSLVVTILDPRSAYAGIVTRLLQPLYGSLLGASTRLGGDAAWASVAIETGASGLIGFTIAATTLLVVTALSATSGRLLCNTLCPVGSALSLVSRHSVFHIEIDTDLCTHCHRCEHVCKAQCINLVDHVVDNSRCIDCFNCLAACNDHAISYTSRRKQLSIPMMQRLSLDGSSPMGMAGSAKQSITHEKSSTDQNIDHDETISRPAAPCQRKRHRQG